MPRTRRTPRTPKTLLGVYIEQRQHSQLQQLSDATSIPMAVYVRQALDMMLEAHAAELQQGNASPTK